MSFRWTPIYSGIVSLFVVLGGFPLSSFAHDQKSDSDLLRCQELLQSGHRPEWAKVQAAAENFEKFFSSLRSRLYEREFFLRAARLALLSKEHILILGPPGNAKSMGVDLIIDHILDDNGAPSVFKIQMTPETTLSETHGVIDYKKITEENIQTRQYEQGLLSAKLVFIDEFFDARANAIRNNLMALNEREHAQGRERIKGIIETGFAASNKYVDEVYEKAGDDGPKATIDRFAMVIFAPGDLETVDSAHRLITETGGGEVGTLRFRDLDLLRARLDDVQTPSHIASILTLMFHRMKSRTEMLEQAEKKQYQDQRRNGGNPLPPYRSTKYYSPRTLRKAGKILKAIVLNDWIEKKGERSLVANTEDVEKLISFFTLNSVSDEFLSYLEDAAVNPYEKVQVMTVRKEREIFSEVYLGMMSEINSRTAVLTDLEIERESAVTPELRRAFVEKLTTTFLEMMASEPRVRLIRELSEKEIANAYIQVTLEAWLREELGSEYDGKMTSKITEMKAQQEKRLAEQQRLDRERIENERKEEIRKQRRLQQFQILRGRLSTQEEISVSFSAGIPSTSALDLYRLDEDRAAIMSIESAATVYTILSLQTGEVIEQKIFETGPEHRAPVKITRLDDRRYLFWYGADGLILDLEHGWQKPQVTYDKNEHQIISDVVDGHFYVLHRSRGHLGVVQVDNLAEIQWKDLSLNNPEFQIQGGGSKNVFISNLVGNEARLTVSKDEEGVLYLTSYGFREPFRVYRIDLNRNRAQVVLDHPKGDSRRRREPARVSLDHDRELFFVEIPGSDQDETRQVEAHQILLRSGGTSKSSMSFRMKQVDVGFLSNGAWDIAPTGDYLLFFNNQRQRIQGLDLSNGQGFELPLKVEGVKQVIFLSSGVLLLCFERQNLAVIYKLPTGED